MREVAQVYFKGFGAIIRAKIVPIASRSGREARIRLDPGQVLSVVRCLMVRGRNPRDYVELGKDGRAAIFVLEGRDVTRELLGKDFPDADELEAALFGLEPR